MDADDDSDVQVEVEEEMDETEVHPTSLDNKAPAFLIQHYQTAVVFLQNYGWYIVLVVIILIILKNRLEPYLRRVSHQMEQQRELRVDPDVAERRLEAMDAHRKRLQEEFDAKAARFAEEQKKKEEDRRKAKIEDWDRHLMGEGYRSRTRQGEDREPSGDHGPTPRPPRRPTTRVYRPSDYNPLTGDDGGNAFYRPPRRGGAGGGGGG